MNNKDDQKRDAILKKMLETPPKPNKPLKEDIKKGNNCEKNNEAEIIDYLIGMQKTLRGCLTCLIILVMWAFFYGLENNWYFWQ